MRAIALSRCRFWARSWRRCVLSFPRCYLFIFSACTRILGGGGDFVRWRMEDGIGKCHIYLCLLDFGHPHFVEYIVIFICIWYIFVFVIVDVQYKYHQYLWRARCSMYQSWAFSVIFSSFWMLWFLSFTDVALIFISYKRRFVKDVEIPYLPFTCCN